MRSLYDTYDPNTPREQPGDHSVAQGSDGSFLATAARAEIVGETAALEDGPIPNIGHWDDLGDYAQWMLKVTTPGSFRVVVEEGVDPSSPGGEYTVDVGRTQLKGKVEVTQDWHDYKMVDLGEVRLDEAGDVPLAVKPTLKPNGFVMNLRSVRLVPQSEKKDKPTPPTE